MKINLERLHTVTAKGHTYHYAWRGGPRIEAKYGTKEFFEEYWGHHDPARNMDRRRIGTWLVLFKASKDYARIGASTLKDWGPMLDNARDYFGKLSVGAFDKPEIRGDIKKWRDKNWGHSDRQADKAKQALSRFCSFMKEEGVLSVNPCEGIANLYSANRADIIWTDEDFTQLATGAPREIVWAARFAALTGWRQAACLEVPWTRVEKHCIDMRNTKHFGKGRGLCPIYPALRALLDELPRRALTVLTTTGGTPWQSGFGASWNTAMNKSGLIKKGLHFHDTRGTGATNLYKSGLNSREIADVMGWQIKDVERMIELYVKRDELMLEKIRKMERIGIQPENEKAQVLG